MSERPLSPNEKYAALVSAAGYAPVALGPEEFIRRLPDESSLRTTTTPWFIHQLRMIAHTIEAATAPEMAT
jgi:hypothetical protein